MKNKYFYYFFMKFNGRERDARNVLYKDKGEKHTKLCLWNLKSRNRVGGIDTSLILKWNFEKYTLKSASAA